MIVCKHEPVDEILNRKFTVIFEVDDINMLDNLIDKAEGNTNFEKVVYRMIVEGYNKMIGS